MHRLSRHVLTQQEKRGKEKRRRDWDGEEKRQKREGRIGFPGPQRKESWPEDGGPETGVVPPCYDEN